MDAVVAEVNLFQPIQTREQLAGDVCEFVPRKVQVDKATHSREETGMQL